MIHVAQAIIVEGKYDKIKLSNLIDTLIIETNGFTVFKDNEECSRDNERVKICKI